MIKGSKRKGLEGTGRGKGRPRPSRRPQSRRNPAGRGGVLPAKALPELSAQGLAASRRVAVRAGLLPAPRAHYGPEAAPLLSAMSTVRGATRRRSRCRVCCAAKPRPGSGGLRCEPPVTRPSEPRRPPGGGGNAVDDRRRAGAAVSPHIRRRWSGRGLGYGSGLLLGASLSGWHVWLTSSRR